MKYICHTCGQPGEYHFDWCGASAVFQRRRANKERLEREREEKRLETYRNNPETSSLPPSPSLSLSPCDIITWIFIFYFIYSLSTLR